MSSDLVNLKWRQVILEADPERSVFVAHSHVLGCGVEAALSGDVQVNVALRIRVRVHAQCLCFNVQHEFNFYQSFRDRVVDNWTIYFLDGGAFSSNAQFKQT